MACYSNEQVREAKRQYDKITADPDLRSLLICEEIDELDRNTRINKAKREGHAEGRAEGRVAGERENQIKIAKKMKSKNMSIEEIIELTELSKEEIEAL